MKTLRLHIHEGPCRATLVFSHFPVVVGREPSADCVLSSPFVSRRHARIDLRDGRRLTLSDEGSSLGTWVHNSSRRLPVGLSLDLESVSNEFAIAHLRLRAELCESAASHDSPEGAPRVI